MPLGNATTRRGLETTTDYQNPHRPLPVRVFNRIGRSWNDPGVFAAPGTGRLLDDARRKTGLLDFGDDGHFEALQVLLQSIGDEAELTATGRLIQRNRLSGALACRLRIEHLLNKHPEILDVDLGSVIVITGLQRTGTTLLHRLLHCNPDIRGVSGEEALDPVPAGGAAGRMAAGRRRRALLAQRAIAYLSPQFMKVHPIDHGEPEEDVLLLDLNFMSQAPEATMHVPTYSRWLEQQDHTRNYEYFRKILKILCWQRPAGQWVLKTPHHMEYLDALLKVFPEATIVQTHRDPQMALPSFCSMVAHSRAIFSDRVDPVEIGDHWCRKTRRMVELTMETRAAADSERFVDVSYHHLLDDPMAQLRRIYDRIGLEFDHEAERIARQYLKKNPKNRYGKHTYRLSDFGLNGEVVERQFADYRAQHAIPFERSG